MSTPCELIIYATNKPKADGCAKAILAETKRLEKKYNYFKDDSLLSQINSRLIQEIDNETKTLLQRASQYYHATQGVFDITVATFKDLYTQALSPEDLEVKKEELSRFVGCEHFTLKKKKIIFDNVYTKVDLGGFVKEYAVDRAVYMIKKEKIESALINYGGDIYALGKKPDGNRFCVGIKDPKNPQSYAKEIEIENQALTTSASYERNVRVGSKSYSHIISKARDASLSRSVTVISHNCVESGVFSTALMLNPDLKTEHELILL